MDKRVIIVLIIGVLVIAAAFIFGRGKPVDQVACTEEALMCPDGSSVGRQGPKCEFAACPNQGAFTGRLTQTETGYVLIMGDVSGTPGEVTYTLPLQFSRISNVLSEFIGEEVQVTGTFTSGNMLSVDTIDYADAGLLGDVKVGETKLINGVYIKLNSIVEDSRCPIDAVCIQAGRVVANVTLTIEASTISKTVNISSDSQTPYILGNDKISIARVRPSPISSEPQTSRDYVVTFRVE